MEEKFIGLNVHMVFYRLLHVLNRLIGSSITYFIDYYHIDFFFIILFTFTL